MLFSQRFYVLVVLITAVSAMNMDHDDMENDEDSTATYSDAHSTTNTSNVIPTAHEVKHQHGLPILETHLTPAERAYWESYNTTTYFTIESPKKSALWLHCFTVFATFFVLYPIALVLGNVKSK